jgi:DNA-binding NarL/FixJ family response regulator
MIRVLIADDQAVVRAGLRMIFESEHDLDIVGEAADGAVAVELVQSLHPDVVLMDIRMPASDGIEATRQIVAAGARARVLVLTTYGLDEYVYAALKVGASGFMLKTESPDRLIDAVRVVAAGEALLAPEITRRLIDHFVGAAPPPTPPPAGLDQLTARERDVLTHLARGHSNAEIATALFVGEGTVKTHVSRIFAKLHLHDRAQAVVMAYESGLVRPGGEAERGIDRGGGRRNAS